MQANADRPDSPAPTVSVGLPVYNGARYLAEAFDSLLGQTWRDLELIVSDNASTDDTAAICRDYAARDARIRYVRQPTNIGAPRNWSYVAQVARGRYFKWASCNDRCSKNLLQRCVEELERQPQAVLCYGKAILVDEDTDRELQYDGDFPIQDERPSDRLEHLLRKLQLNNAQSGLIRLDALRQTGLDRPYPAGDLPLMGELALRGTFELLPDVQLYRRMGQRTFSRGLAGRAQADFYGTGSTAMVHLLRRHRDLSLAVLRAPIAIGEKTRSWAFLMRYLYWDLRHSMPSLSTQASGRT